MKILTAEERREFQNTILSHYELHGRDFPWRNTQNPYEILVSEIMLQQTQTDRVVPKYIAWLRKFPSVRELASASLCDVLAAWNGLGYNRRARFLQETCKIIDSDYDGKFPEDPAVLVSFPGIGNYTAKAVATFSFNRPEIFIETNIRSVFIFFFFADEKNVSDAELLPLIEQVVDYENPRIWYYALMDYGAVLKRHVKNPNRQSRHYSKQSKFDGSFRQARGAVIRCLTSANARGGASAAYIAEEEHLPLERVKEAADCLCAEKILYQESGIYRIL